MFYVYRFKDIHEQIIYVGKTKNIESRMKQHFSEKGHLNKECYERVITIEYIELKNDIDMSIKELYYINKWNPEYNKKDNNRNKCETIISEDKHWKVWMSSSENKKRIIDLEEENLTLRMELERCKKELVIKNEIIKCSDEYVNIHPTINKIKKDEKTDKNINSIKLSESEILNLRKILDSEIHKGKSPTIIYEMLSSISIKESWFEHESNIAELVKANNLYTYDEVFKMVTKYVSKLNGQGTKRNRKKPVPIVRLDENLNYLDSWSELIYVNKFFDTVGFKVRECLNDISKSHKGYKWIRQDKYIELFNENKAVI